MYTDGHCFWRLENSTNVLPDRACGGAHMTGIMGYTRHTSRAGAAKANEDGKSVS